MKTAIVSSILLASCLALPVEDNHLIGDALLDVSLDASVGLEPRNFNFWVRQRRTTARTTARTTTPVTTARTTSAMTPRAAVGTSTTSSVGIVTTTTTRAVAATTGAASSTTRATTASPAPPSSSGSSDGSSTYIDPIVYQHNIHRSNHSASAIAWDTGLANTAQKIAANCVYAHNTTADGGGYGQNIGAGYTPNQVPGMITNGMYNGEMDAYPGYTKEPDMSTFGKWGHFTQIVWQSTQRVGCYTQYCPNGLGNTGGNIRPYFTVCNYATPGNYIGQFNASVKATLGNPTVFV